MHSIQLILRKKICDRGQMTSQLIHRKLTWFSFVLRRENKKCGTYLYIRMFETKETNQNYTFNIMLFELQLIVEWSISIEQMKFCKLHYGKQQINANKILNNFDWNMQKTTQHNFFFLFFKKDGIHSTTNTSFMSTDIISVKVIIRVSNYKKYYKSQICFFIFLRIFFTAKKTKWSIKLFRNFQNDTHSLFRCYCRYTVWREKKVATKRTTPLWSMLFKLDWMLFFYLDFHAMLIR